MATLVNKDFGNINYKNLSPDGLAYDGVKQGEMGKPVTGKEKSAGKYGDQLKIIGKPLSDVPLIADAAKKGVSTALDGKQFDAKFWASGSKTQFDMGGNQYSDDSGKERDAGL